MPLDPTSLFDNDDDIEMASTLSSHSGQSSSVSRPPTSESEGPTFDDPEEDEEDEDDDKSAEIKSACSNSKKQKTKVCISFIPLKRHSSVSHSKGMPLF